MSRSSLPSPASTPVHVVDADAPLWVTVQTGEPPRLKCGLAATAVAAVSASVAITATRTVDVRLIGLLPSFRVRSPALE
jgi:hypothetical protein